MDVTDEGHKSSAQRENRRLRTLERYDVLDAPPTNAFDRITRLAARLFGVPIAMINFIDRKEQWCLSAHGLAMDRMSREASFCARAIQKKDVMIVEDARADERFADNPLVTGEPHIRFYAGAPLTAPNGYRLGTLCLFDKSPRTFSEEERETLTDLAGVVMDELTLRHYTSDLDASRQALQETSEHQAHILESITDAFIALDDEWNVTYANAQAEVLVERTREELLGQSVWDIFPEAVGTRFHEKYEKALDEQESVEFVEYYPPLNRWFEARAFPFEGGLSIYFDDVTDRMEARESLRRERDLVEGIMDTSVAAIVVVDAVGYITFANERAGEILGAGPDELRGTKHHETGALAELDGNELSPEEWPFRHIVETGESVSEKRFIFERPDGTTRYISVNGAPLRHPDGEIRQVVFSIDDVSDQIQYERELKAAKQEAERANRLKSSFLTNVTHDLRTPLSSILSLAELLAVEAPDEYQDRIKRIEKSGRRLLKTVDSVLDLAKIETGAIEPELESIDLADELLGTVEIFQPQATEKGIALDAEVEQDPMPAELDPTMVHRIVDNLLKNALKFTDAGGRVTLRAHEENDTITIEVEDTGPGIDEDFLPDLFESFSQGSNRQGQEGSGLGLAITKQLTELMGGTIEVESEKGVGTTFRVHLPR